MKQKKILAMLTAVMLLVSSLGLTAFAEGTGVSDTVSVYVTIADGDGKLALAQEKIEVTDRDGDGKFTIDEALYAAHEAKYEGGTAAGYKAEDTPSAYGGTYYTITKLWGVENGINYSYYLNNMMSGGLSDTVKDGDYLNAYVYVMDDCSDSYSYFDKNTVSVKQNEEITLALSRLVGFDENDYSCIFEPAEDMIITMNGIETNYKTDANGKATIKLTEAGTCVISAVSKKDDVVLVPPVCIATVKAVAVPDNTGNVADTKADSTPKTGDAVNAIVYGVLMIVAFATVLVVTGREKKYYEK